MKNMFNVTTVLPHNLLQTNPCIRHNFSTQVKLCRALSEDLYRKVANARVRLQEVVRQNGGHIEHVIHYEQFSSL